MRYKKAIAFLTILVTVVLFNYVYSEYSSIPISFHTDKEKYEFRNVLRSPIDSGEYFLHSENCQGCHGYDSLNYANIDANGVSVNVYDDWEATMMANSARDPLWRAKVSHEILVNPSHSTELQTKCTSCHAPMGNYTAHFKGINHYTISDLENDSLGLNGVSCVACHAIGPDGLGSLFSGNIPYDSTHNEYGPYTNPLTGPMQLYVGMTPLYGSHMSESKVCSSCHTLITNTADLNGNLTGKTFVEQATFHEWKNSSYADDNLTCQNCHMPKILDSVIIANQYLNLPPRSPFNRHKFMGGNVFMINLIKENKNKLGITTSNRNFDSTLANTNRMLKIKSLAVDLVQDSLTSDTLFLSLKLTNKAGHKFPSGYPSRRAVVQLVAVSIAGDTVFKSGLFDPDYEVVNINSNYEEHYNVINNQERTQIYEMVMGDVNKNKTTVLERADTALKDNRIPPEGFNSFSDVYDTVKIVGSAISDPDFNRYNGGAQGTGRDVVHYRIPVAGLNSFTNVYAKVYYQTVPPGWLKEMFTYNSAPIDSFKNMYQAADKKPVLVGADSVLSVPVGINNAINSSLNIYPSPTTDGYLTFSLGNKTKLSYVRIYNTEGKLIKQHNGVTSENNKFVFQLPDPKGTYFIEISDGYNTYFKKVLFQ